MRRVVGALAVLVLAAAGPLAGAQSLGELGEELRDLLEPIDDLLESLPDRGAVLASKLDRGELVRQRVADRTPEPKVVDGDPSDWIGRSAGIASQWHLDAGELIYTDYLFDAYGADDGGDRQRLDDFAGLFYAVQRIHRIDDVLRTSGSQLGVPEPLGASDNYGDHNRDLAVGDLAEVRLAADNEHIYLLTTFTNWTEENRHRLGLLVLSDSGGSPAGCSGEAPLVACDGASATWRPGGTPLRTERFDTGVLLGADRVLGAASVRDGRATALPGDRIEVATDTTGWTNALEAAVPTEWLAPSGVIDFTVISGILGEDGSFTPTNVAFRPQEPIDIHNERLQAFAFLEAAGEPAIDEFSSGSVDLENLRRGASEEVRPGPGYHEAVFTSGENISQEQGQNGIRQHYGLYVPTSFSPRRKTPLTLWLHYRGGKAHSAAAINPRLIRQLGEERGNLVVSPRGRGTSTWYVTQAHQDVWEVFDDVHDRFPQIDPSRRYLSGYSMGGYGTYLFGLLYPDMFAGGLSQSGAMTQGAWLGGGPDDQLDPFIGEGWIEANEGDANRQLTYRLLENARYFPIAIDHGTTDYLVPITGVERMALRLLELGYRHQYTRFIGYEHFTQAIVDEWAGGAAYLDSFAVPECPRYVTYKVVPALVEALNTVRSGDAEFSFNPDGAWWVSDIVPREANPDDPSSFALVDATSHAIVEEPTLPLPTIGLLSPLEHTTPFLRTGLDWITNPLGEAQELRNTFELELTNVAEVTLDLDCMGLVPGPGQMATGSVQTDGPVTVRMLSAGEVQEFSLPPGSSEVTVRPVHSDVAASEDVEVLAATKSVTSAPDEGSSVMLPLTRGNPGRERASEANVGPARGSTLAGAAAVVLTLSAVLVARQYARRFGWRRP